MPTISVYFTPSDYENTDFSGRTVVMVDVLRASTSMITALANGCRQILPAMQVQDAEKMAAELPRHQILKCGERGGEKIPGFDLGNSPLEYRAERVANQTLIMTTTNGTRALLYGETGNPVYVLALVNLFAVSQACLETRSDIAVLCAGREGEFSEEDTVCAGLLVDKVMETKPAFTKGAGAGRAQELALPHKNNLFAMLKNSVHGKTLQKLGFSADLEFCSRLNVYTCVPVFADGHIQNKYKR